MKTRLFVFYTLGLIFLSFPATVFGDGSCKSTTDPSIDLTDQGFSLVMKNLNISNCSDTNQLSFLNSVAELKDNYGPVNYNENDCTNFKNSNVVRAYQASSGSVKEISSYTLSAHDFTFNETQYTVSCTQTKRENVSIPGSSYKSMETCTCTWTPQPASASTKPLPEDENGAYYYEKDGDGQKSYAWFFTKNICLKFLTEKECVWPKVH